jgi:hypothetical protein
MAAMSPASVAESAEARRRQRPSAGERLALIATLAVIGVPFVTFSGIVEHALGSIVPDIAEGLTLGLLIGYYALLIAYMLVVVLAVFATRLEPRATPEAREAPSGLAEYSLILALIAVVAIIALMFLGSQVSK